MRDVQYTDSELWVKDELERLFWIEIAKRKACMVQRKLFSMLLELRSELDAFFKGQDADLESQLENGVDIFWDVIQFHRTIAEVTATSEHAVLMHKALENFADKANYVLNNLPYYKGFCLSDFSTLTDLEMLHDWWMYINSGDGRRALNAEGKFSSSGKQRLLPATSEIWFAGEDSPMTRVGEMVMTISSISNPVRMPRRVTERRIWNFSTDDHEIRVDGHPLKDRVVFAFDLLKPLPSIREIEKAIWSAHGLAQAQRSLAMLEAGIFPDEIQSAWTKDGAFDIKRAITTLPEEYKLMVAQNSVRPLIFGLCCWDLVADGQTDAQACKKAVSKLVGNKGKPDYSQKRAMYGLKLVRSKIEAYEPDQLPWNH